MASNRREVHVHRAEVQGHIEADGDRELQVALALEPQRRRAAPCIELCEAGAAVQTP